MWPVVSQKIDHALETDITHQATGSQQYKEPHLAYKVYVLVYYSAICGNKQSTSNF